ncbi:MAG: hypothetical protein GEV28_07270 [Actinophytocola sp.]|uniref:hypothetical protein n=1 Tax=Actinophytocola sp. TaxID=1872138 RepID=UPI001321C61E|nr:hypothetical protein [Actinophytocola sp.]MPZ80191.1 hypothetical protein [Actinophytocola sp.]
MAASAASSARAATSTDAQLRALVARGFRFVDPRDENGDIVAVVGVRAHHNVVDVVQLHGEDEVVAARVPPDQDILAPSRVFWREVGPVDAVLGAMLALPDDRTPGLVLTPNRASA